MKALRVSAFVTMMAAFGVALAAGAFEPLDDFENWVANNNSRCGGDWWLAPFSVGQGFDAGGECDPCDNPVGFSGACAAYCENHLVCSPPGTWPLSYSCDNGVAYCECAACGPGR
jgi:hypothetical protein